MADTGFTFTRTHTHLRHKISVYVHEDANINDVAEAFVEFLKACGFSQKAINERFPND